jgi:hypothetical protein
MVIEHKAMAIEHPSMALRHLNSAIQMIYAKGIGSLTVTLKRGLVPHLDNDRGDQ